MKISPLSKYFAAVVTDIDLSSTLNSDTIQEIKTAIADHGVLVFPNQNIDDVTQVRFTEQFGQLEIPLAFDQYAGVHPSITRLSNVDDDDEVMEPESHHVTYMKGNLLWHTDSSFKSVPARYSLLHAREVPDGVAAGEGNTEFSDCRSAWDNWEKSNSRTPKDQLRSLVCEHSIVWSRSQIIGDFFTDIEKASMPPVQRALVKRHPVTNRDNFYAGAHCSHVIGWPLEKGRQLIKEINDWSTQPAYRYSHAWRTNDLIIWDNRRVLHRGLPHNPAKRRIMHRTTVQCGAEEIAAEAKLVASIRD